MTNIRVKINTKALGEIEAILAQRFEKAGQYIENTAKENMEDHNRSGILRASIHHEADKDGAVIGTSEEYAIPFHEGHGSFAGVPFLKNAVYDNLSQIENILGGG